MSAGTSVEGCTRAQVRLGDVIRRFNMVIHPGDRAAGTARFVGLEHIESGTGRRTGEAKVDFAAMTGRKPLFQRGQIVYGYLRPYLNKVWIADFDGCSSVDQFAFDVNEASARPAYLAAFLRSETFLKSAAKVTTPGQLPRISIEEIESVRLDLPPLSEQERIAGRLSEQMAGVERARAAAAQRLAAAQALPAAYFREVFEGPKSRTWDAESIADVAEVQGGFAFKSEWFIGEGVRVLRNANVHQGFVEWDEAVFLSVERARVFPSLTLAKGDIVLSLDRPVVAGGLKAAQLAANDLPALLNQRVARFNLREEKMDREFFYHFVRSPTFIGGLPKHDHSLGVPHVSPAQVGDIVLRLPPLPEQKRIAADLSRRLAEAERLTGRLREELAAIDALPAALLREAFGN